MTQDIVRHCVTLCDTRHCETKNSTHRADITRPVAT